MSKLLFALILRKRNLNQGSHKNIMRIFILFPEVLYARVSGKIKFSFILFLTFNFLNS